jgi:hypothetical protein
MLSLPLSPTKQWFFATNEIIQYAVELSTPRHADAFIDFVTKSVSACHLRSDGVNLIYDSTPLSVTAIPPSLHSARDASIWAGTSNLPVFSHRLATIAARDTLVVLSVTHSLADGVSFLHLTRRFLSGEIERAPTFPISLDDRLKNELTGPIDANQHISDVSRLSTLLWSDTIEPNLPDDVRCEYQFVELPPNAFQCYDSMKNKLIGFTDALWRSSVLACAAMNPIQRNFGTSTCVNMRTFINDTSIGNIFSPLCVIADQVSDQTTIGELEKRLRSDFTKKIKQKAYLSSLKATLNGYQFPATRTALTDVSNVEIFQIEYPLVDLWIQQTMKSREISSKVSSWIS